MNTDFQTVIGFGFRVQQHFDANHFISVSIRVYPCPSVVELQFSG